ncbi:phosphatidate cytidylyltransferase, partial [Candidatus Aerophobetes bacterium]|nr:phosphatidate cytidylyltransferase [Candidatus Aerophobetes bacterium]
IIIIREIPQMGERLVITVLFATWMGDTGAFTVGSIFGKHKFFPVYSSQKSIEGFIGAIFFSLIAMFISTLWVHFPILHVIVLGIIAGVGGEMGDFFESMLKRGLGIKDFGRILPGHGGVLDRFDSLFFTVPCFFYYIKYIIGQVAG